MATKAKDIKAAVGLMDKNDATLWNADGAPKLDTVQGLVGDPALTAADVAMALGLPAPSTEPAATIPDPSKPTETQIHATGADEDKPDNIDMMDPNSPEFAIKVLASARDAKAAIDAKIDEQIRARDNAAANILKLTAEADVHIGVIETYGPRVSHAQAVKAIQQQTVRQAAATRERMHLAATALAANGVLAAPSKLDAALMGRRRTPEQVQNQATYIHQQAAARNAGRV